MGKAIMAWAIMAASLIAAEPVAARGLHIAFGGGHHGHAINAWMGSRHPRLR